MNSIFNMKQTNGNNDIFKTNIYYKLSSNSFNILFANIKPLRTKFLPGRSIFNSHSQSLFFDLCMWFGRRNSCSLIILGEKKTKTVSSLSFRKQPFDNLGEGVSMGFFPRDKLFEHFFPENQMVAALLSVNLVQPVISEWPVIWRKFGLGNNHWFSTTSKKKLYLISYTYVLYSSTALACTFFDELLKLL